MAPSPSRDAPATGCGLRGVPWRHRAHFSERRTVQGNERARQYYGWPHIEDALPFLWQLLRYGPALAEEIEHRHRVEEIVDFLEIEAIRKVPVARLPYGLQ